MDSSIDIEAQTDPWIELLLVGVGYGACIVSTIAEGDGALLLVPILNFVIGTSSTAPVLKPGIGRLA